MATYAVVDRHVVRGLSTNVTPEVHDEVEEIARDLGINKAELLRRMLLAGIVRHRRRRK